MAGRVRSDIESSGDGGEHGSGYVVIIVEDMVDILDRRVLFQESLQSGVV